MKVKVSKKTIFVMVIILVVALLGVGGYFGFEFIKTNNKIKETEQKLSNIDAEELKEKIIKELEQTELKKNVDSIEDGMIILAEFGEGYYFKGYITETIVGMYGTSTIGTLEMPCFKINSDKNGKFKSIEYYEYSTDWWAKDSTEGILSKSIKDVLKKEYDVDCNIERGYFSANYYKRFNKVVYEQKEFVGTNTNFCTLVINKILNRETRKEITYNMRTTQNKITFGL